MPRATPVLGLLAAGAALSIGAGQSAAQYPTPTAPTPTTTAPRPAAPNTVVIKGSSGDYRFSPRTLKVARGTRVHWTWKSDAEHNVTFTTLHRHSRTREQGTYGLTFRTRGTYRYLCTVHDFSAKIVVK